MRSVVRRSDLASLGVAVLLVAGMAVGLANRSSAGTVPGGGKPATDCYIGLNVDGVTVPPNTNRVECNECDPSCDADGAANGSCTFRVAACTNIVVPGCTGVPLKKAKVTPTSLNIKPPSDLSNPNSACGSFVNVTVPTKSRGTKPGKRVLTLFAQRDQKPRLKDKEKITLVCIPSNGVCPTTSTSSSTSTSSTTIVEGTTSTSTSIVIVSSTTTTAPPSTTTT